MHPNSQRFRRGLVVGKFAPLHRGHELVIRHALARCDEVLLVSYSKPEFAGCEPERRARWLEERFPSARVLVVTDERLRRWPLPDWNAGGVPANDADAGTHRRFVGSLCRHVLKTRVEAVFTSEDYGDGFAAELTAYFRHYEPEAPEVCHVLVDRDRRQAPISGTALRADVHAHRHWLAPEVYAGFVRRVCLLGGESSGKSTLAAALADHLGTAHVPEYGRTLWEAKGGQLEFADLLAIAERQVVLEEAAARRAVRHLFCDTSPLTTLFYSRHLFGRADPALERLAERRYDLTILCAPDFAYVQDGTREGEALRMRQHAWYVEELTRRGIPFLLAQGSVPDRVASVAGALP